MAVRQGWTATKQGRHWKLYYPDGRYACSLPTTPGKKSRTLPNNRAMLRRVGLDVT